MAKQSMSKNALALPSLSRKLFCRDVTREEAEDLEEVGFGADVVVSWRGAGSVAVESMELVVGAAKVELVITLLLSTATAEELGK